MDVKFDAVAVFGRTDHDLLDQPANDVHEWLLGLGIGVLPQIVHQRIDHAFDHFRGDVVRQIDRLGGPGHFQFLSEASNLDLKLIDHVVEACDSRSVGLDAIGDLFEDRLLLLLPGGNLLFKRGDAVAGLCLSRSYAFLGGGNHGLDVDQVPERVRDTSQHPVFQLLPADGLGVGTDASVKVIERQLLASVRAAVAIFP
nr:hypothetical protein [Hoeflea phototrophica]